MNSSFAFIYLETLTSVFTCSLWWPDPTAQPRGAPLPPCHSLPSPPAPLGAGSPPESTITRTISKSHPDATLIKEPAERPTHQSVDDSQQHVESLDPRLDILPLWRQNHHWLHVSPRQVVVMAAWITSTQGKSGTHRGYAVYVAQIWYYTPFKITIKYKGIVYR